MPETVERVTPGTDSWREYGEEHLQRYVFFSDLYGGKSVIDAACGTGYGSHYIALQGAGEVSGIDISEEALQFARSHYQLPHLSFTRLDCTDPGRLNKQVDLVISFETIEHLSNPELFIKNVAAALKPGGQFICSTPNKARLSGAGNFNPFHPSELEWADFKRLFEKYFEVTASYHQSESPNYFRYLELRHILHQEHARNNAFLFNRFELLMRKLFRKNFQPIPFIHTHLTDQLPGDMVIESFSEPEPWHKTFIIAGQLKKQ